jgi:hypothetical protein
MNSNILSELQARIVVVAIPVAEDPIEVEWANVNDCGALGPNYEEPSLFYQDVQDWEEPLV